MTEGGKRKKGHKNRVFCVRLEMELNRWKDKHSTNIKKEHRKNIEEKEKVISVMGNHCYS